jgi:hypothetical protein
VFSIVELKTTALDSGITGVSPTHMLLLFLMMLAISMIPYLFLYVSLRDKQGRASTTTKPFERMIGWLHVHRHPELLHH